MGSIEVITVQFQPFFFTYLLKCPKITTKFCMWQWSTSFKYMSHMAFTGIRTWG